MAIVNYFVEILEKTKTSADSLTGDTSITVESASQFSSGDPIYVGSDKYTIDTISDSTITLTEATVADYLTGTVVKYDDSDLDGLSVSSAKKTTMFISGTADDEAYVWVRRSGTHYVDGIESAGYSKIIQWPFESDDYYSDRPQDGIDAGWDDDETAATIDVGTSKVLSLPGDIEIANFSNILVSPPSMKSSFSVSNSTITIVNSSVLGVGLGGYDSLFFRENADESGVVNVIRSSIDSGDQTVGVFSYLSSETDEYSLEFNITDSTIKYKNIIRIYTDSSSYSYKCFISINISNNSFLYLERFHYGVSRYNNTRDLIDAEIIDSTVETTSDLYYGIGYSNDYTVVIYRKFLIKGSSVSCNGGASKLFNVYGDSTSYTTTESGSIILIDSSISCYHIIDDYAAHITLRNLTVIGCELYLDEKAINLDYAYLRQIVFKWNNINKNGGDFLFNIANTATYGFDVSFKNCSLPCAIASRARIDNLYLERVIIDGSPTPESGRSTGVIKNCSFTKIGGTPDVDIIDSSMAFADENSIFGDGGNVRMYNCDIDIASGIDTVVDKDVKVSVVSSRINGDMFSQTGFSNIEMYNCVIDDVDVIYSESTAAFVAKQSDSKRLDSSANGIAVSPPATSNIGVVSIEFDKLYAKYTSGTSIVKLYFLINDSRYIDLRSFAEFPDGDDYFRSVKGTISLGDLSEWDVVPDGFSAYVYEFDISEYTEPVADTEFNIPVSCIVDPAEDYCEIIIDPIVVFE